MKEKIKQLQIQVLDGITKQQELNQEIRRMEKSNVRFQLENYQLRAQRDVLLAAMADAQRRIQVLRIKNRPCSHGCGSGVNEDSDETGMPFTDSAAGSTMRTK